MAGLLFIASFMGACAHYPVNQPVLASGTAGGYRLDNIRPSTNSDNLLVVLTFSGGATSSAALSYGVLQGLAGTVVYYEGRERRLIDEVDIISAVSGGSFTTAYYGLHGDGIFKDFEGRFLKKDMQTAMINYLIAPANLLRMSSPTFCRSDAAAEFFDSCLFDGATFADIQARGGPFVMINASDLSLGTHFSFTQDQFDLIGSELSSFSVARAVTAASAVPGFFTPIALKNYRGGGTAYLHLVDGGVSDNLGVRPVLDRIAGAGGLAAGMLGSAERVVFIVVNAETKSRSGQAMGEEAPSISRTLRCATGAMINRYNLDTMDLLNRTLKKWDDGRRTAREGGQGGQEDGPRYYIVEVNLDLVKDASERDYLNDLPISFNLPPGAVDRLTAAARKILSESPEFKRLIKDMGRSRGGREN